MILGHVLIALVLTAVTQVGGVAWLGALILRGTGPARALRHGVILVTLYFGLSVLAWSVAPSFGRVALPCRDGSVPGLVVDRFAFCAMNRHYVAVDLAQDLRLAGAELAEQGRELRVLDGGFPFPMPMLPHLSHGSARAVDVAIPLSAGRAPFGYWAYIQPRAGDPQPCLGQERPLRWDLDGLQPARIELDEAGLRAQVQAVLARPDLHILIEPHLERRIGLDSDRLRFQGCHAARHDDHFHIVKRP